MKNQTTQPKQNCTKVSQKKKGKKGCLIALIVPIIIIAIGVSMGSKSDGSTKTKKLSSDAKLIKDICCVTDEQALEIEEILTLCEISNLSQIEHDELLDGAYNDGDLGYRIKNTDTTNIILYLSENKEVFAVRYAGVDLYKDDVVKEKMSSFFLTTTQTAELKTITQEYVKTILRSPSTADFPWFDWQISKSYFDGTATVSSYVDAKNAFGAEVRSYFTLIYKLNGNTYSLLYFVFDNEVLVDNR